MRNPSRRAVMTSSAAVIAAGALGARGALAQQAPIKVIVFPGLSNMAIFAAQRNGFLEKHKVAIELVNTPNSSELRDGLAQGRYQIAHAAVDNAVAQIENQKVDAAIVIGGDGGLNQLFVQPEIKSIEDIKGKTVAVDAPNTAFALLLYKMLASKGLRKGDHQIKPLGGTPLRLKGMLEDKTYAAGMLNPPFSIQAEKSGKLKSLGSPSALVGPYQSSGGWVLRSWAKANEDLLVRYLRAYVEGQRWALNPANKAAAIAMLQERLRLDSDVATRSYELALEERGGGFVKDAVFNMDGFRNVLALRAEMEGQWGGKPPAPDRFLDLAFYQKAVAGLK